MNGETYTLDIDPDMPLLWALRDYVGGHCTKFGCGIGTCGACMVHFDNEALQSCLVSVADAEGERITTFEGLRGPVAEAVKLAWQDLDVLQCGYCQYGQMMSATALLIGTPDPSDEEIAVAMDLNLCRCGTYPRIAKAVRQASGRLTKG